VLAGVLAIAARIASLAERDAARGAGPLEPEAPEAAAESG
jgi:hypothetical protein